MTRHRAWRLLHSPHRWPRPRRRSPDANYPDRPVRLMVPFPAGSATDIVSRGMAQKFPRPSSASSSWSRTAPGASGNLRADVVAKARARRLHDGLITASTHGVATRARHPSCPTIRSTTSSRSSMIGAAPYVLVLYPGIPAQEHGPELMALAKTGARAS